MRLRYWTAILAGALALMTTALALWSLTQLPIVPVVSWAMLAYFVTIAAVLAMTDRSNSVRPQTDRQERRSVEFKIVTLNPEDWA